MINFGMSMLWFWVCYAIVTCVGILHTIFNIYVLKMKPMDENGMGEGYEKTKPWHPLYNIILFSLFGWLYMNDLAERVGISNVNLSKIKNNKVTAIRFSTLAAICEVLDCEAGDILEYQKD